MQSRIGNGVKWKLFERGSVLGVQFVLQIILARMLDPELYGVLAIMMIFVTIANVFIQYGFSTSLIQNKDVSSDDYSSVFWVSLLIATVTYAIIFVAAPYIGHFYAMPELTVPLRVLTLVVFPGTLNSIQLAKTSKELDFKKVFWGNLIASSISGVVGIVIAINGGGLWALVFQTLLNTTIACIVMQITVKLKIRLRCDFQRVKVLFAYGWKLLVSSLINTLYTDIHSLVVGKKYSTAALGYMNRGKQFPQYVITVIDNTVQSVMLPALAMEQDSRNRLKQIMRQALKTSAYIVFPIMFGLAAVSPQFIKIILTDKWLPCVPYLQIYCFSMAFHPVHSCNLQAINAVGRSDVFLKLEIIKKTYGFVFLILALVLFDSPIYIAITSILTTIISCFVNASPNKRLIDYSYMEQIRDILPALLISALMYVIVSLCVLISIPTLLLLIVQIVVGIGVYILFSWLFKVDSFQLIIGIVRSRLSGIEKC